MDRRCTIEVVDGEEVIVFEHPFKHVPEVYLPTSHYCVLGDDAVVPRARPTGPLRRREATK